MTTTETTNRFSHNQTEFRKGSYTEAEQKMMEIEGDGSSSKDNDERDEFFKKLDYQVIHIPNRVALDYTYLIAQFLGLIVGTNRPEVLFK